MADDIQQIVRLANTDIDGTKRIADAIRDIQGVGAAYANAVVQHLDMPRDRKIGALDSDERQTIQEVISSPDEHGIPSWLRNRRKDRETGENKHLIGADLEMAQKFDIRRLKETGTYRGERHRMGLPVRGQQTQASFRSGEKIGVQRERIQEEAGEGGGEEEGEV